MKNKRCSAGQKLFKKWVKDVNEANVDNWQPVFFSRKRGGYWRHWEKCEQCRNYTKSLFPF